MRSARVQQEGCSVSQRNCSANIATPPCPDLARLSRSTAIPSLTSSHHTRCGSMSTSAPRPSAQGVVIVNAYALAFGLFVQAFFPRVLYGGVIARTVSHWTGLVSDLVVRIRKRKLTGPAAAARRARPGELA